MQISFKVSASLFSSMQIVDFPMGRLISASAKRNQELNEQYQASRAAMMDKFQREMDKKDQVMNWQHVI